VHSQPYLIIWLTAIGFIWSCRSYFIYHIQVVRDLTHIAHLSGKHTRRIKIILPGVIEYKIPICTVWMEYGLNLFRHVSILPFENAWPQGFKAYLKVSIDKSALPKNGLCLCSNTQTRIPPSFEDPAYSDRRKIFSVSSVSRFQTNSARRTPAIL